MEIFSRSIVMEFSWRKLALFSKCSWVYRRVSAWNLQTAGRAQRDFLSGHHHYQIMNNNVGNIVFRQAGFLGPLNDAGNFKLMERIGPSTNYEMPPDVVLLADKGYGDTPRAAQIRHLPRQEQRIARRFNRRLSRCRTSIQHSIKLLKTYQAVGRIWRHPRWFQPIVEAPCTFLA